MKETGHTAINHSQKKKKNQLDQREVLFLKLLWAEKPSVKRIVPFTYKCVRSSSITASLGDYDITVEEGTEQHIKTDLVIRHGPYRSPLHSLAMIRLAKPAQFNQYVQPIPLPSSCPLPGQSCHVSGWGSTTPNQCK